MSTISITSTTVFFAAEILTSSLLVAIGLFWLLRRRNRQFQQSERTLAKQSRALVETFLARELQTMEVLAKTANTDELISTLVRLRSFWLTAEQHALIEHGARGSDYKNIAATLKTSRIYAQLNAQPKPPQKSIAVSSPLPADNTHLDSVSELTIETEESKPPSNPSETTRELNENAVAPSNELLQTISKLEHELREVNTQYHLVRAELEELSKSESPSPAPVVIATAAPIPNVISTAQKSQALLDEMRATFDHSSGELKRLRETNSRQRDLILEMETRLRTMQPGSTQHQELNQLVEKLQLQLRDYDNCNAILEMEGESLRDRIDTFTQILAGDNKDAAPALRAMSDEEAQLLLKKRQGLDRNTFQMLLAIGAANDLTQAATSVINFLKTQNLHAVLFINGQQNQLWLSTGGAIDARVKSLLISIEPAAGNPRVEDGDAIMMLLPLCRFHLASEAFKGTDGEMLKELMLRGMVLVDLMLTLLDKRPAHSDLIAPQIDQLAHLLADIETQQRHLDSEIQRIIQSHRQELEITLASMATTSSQKMVVQGLLGDFTAELDSVGRAMQILHKSLQLAQHSADEINP